MNSSKPLHQQLLKLQKNIDYRFHSPMLLQNAMTHRSVEGASNNERLEFLGDAVLNLVIAQHLIHRFPHADEGQLSRLRAKLVCKSALAEVGHDLNLGVCIQLGLGEAKSGGQQRHSIIADAVESLIGAIFEDSDFEQTQAQILRWFTNTLASIDLKTAQKDAKTRLQEWCQRGFAELPQYQVLSTETVNNTLEFIVEVRIPEQNLKASAKASSRKKAEQAAAAQLLELIDNTPKTGADHDRF